ncbi:MAG: hypothetical protein AAFQ66_13140 [Pseudomonadota bacterium]
MDPTLALDAARMIHLIGLAMGFGLAIWADFSALRTFVQPMTEQDMRGMHRLHNSIIVGVLVLWASGLYLLYARTGFDLANFTPKLVMKLCVVGLMTINACVIAYFALPTYALYEGYRFGDIRFMTRLKLAVIAGVSLSCWVSALTLGVFTQLRPMSYEDLLPIFGSIFSVGLGGVVSFCVVVPAVIELVLRFSRPTDTVRYY